MEARRDRVEALHRSDGVDLGIAGIARRLEISEPTVREDLRARGYDGLSADRTQSRARYVGKNAHLSTPEEEADFARAREDFFSAQVSGAPGTVRSAARPGVCIGCGAGLPRERALRLSGGYCDECQDEAIVRHSSPSAGLGD